MAKPTTLYISDLDGTLLDTESRISDTTAEIISDLTEDGALITVATARTPATVQKLLQSTVTAPPCIVMTGAAMWDRKEKRYIDPQLMPEATATAIMNELETAGVNPFVYCLDPEAPFLEVYHAWNMTRKEIDFYEERRHLPLKKFHIGQRPGADKMNRVILMFAIGPTESVSSASSRIMELRECSVSVYPDIFDPSSSIIEIFSEGVSKSAAALKLKEELKAERLVVFGDNLNDLPMFKVADVSVAVGNALAQVKEKDDITIGTNNENSVARFIERDFRS